MAVRLHNFEVFPPVSLRDPKWRISDRKISPSRFKYDLKSAETGWIEERKRQLLNETPGFPSKAALCLSFFEAPMNARGGGAEGSLSGGPR